MKVLILEDNEKTRLAMVKIVKACASDCDVYDFANRADAYLCALENTIDIFLLDIILEPSSDNANSGITFADSLREYPQYKLTPIIFITTLMGLEAQLLRSIHCYSYIEKPIGDGEILKRHILEAMDAIRGIKKPVKRKQVSFSYDGIGYSPYEDEIIYFSSRRGVLSIYTIDDTIIIPNMSAKSFMKKIHDTTFLVPTYGTMINPSYIECVDFKNREIYLKGISDYIPIGGRLLKSFREEYYKWLG